MWTDVVAAVATGVAAVAALATLVVAIVALRYTRTLLGYTNTQLADARTHTRQQLDEALEATHLQLDETRETTQLQLNETRATAQLQLDEARRLRREQAAPYVVVYARPHDEISGTIIDLVIENTGRTGARDITFRSSPPLIRTDGQGGSQPVRLPEPLPFLAPHQSWRTFWDAGTTRQGTDLESRFTVTVSYTDTFDEPHEEQYVLDLDQFLPRMYPDERTLHHLGKAVEDLAGTMKTWSHRDDVVRVATYDGTAFDEDRARQDAESRAAQADLVRRSTPPTNGDTTGGPAEDNPSA